MSKFNYFLMKITISRGSYERNEVNRSRGRQLHEVQGRAKQHAAGARFVSQLVVQNSPLRYLPLTSLMCVVCKLRTSISVSIVIQLFSHSRWNLALKSKKLKLGAEEASKLERPDSPYTIEPFGSAVHHCSLFTHFIRPIWAILFGNCTMIEIKQGNTSSVRPIRVNSNYFNHGQLPSCNTKPGRAGTISSLIFARKLCVSFLSNTSSRWRWVRCVILLIKSIVWSTGNRVGSMLDRILRNNRRSWCHLLKTGRTCSMGTSASQVILSSWMLVSCPNTSAKVSSYSLEYFMVISSISSWGHLLTIC